MMADHLRKITGAGGGGGCFRKGTQIQLENGKTISIEELKSGDEVLAFDETGGIHAAKVVKLHIHSDPQPVLKIKFWRGEVFITPNHWVLNQYNSFVEVGALSIDDALIDGMGHLRPILSAELIDYEEVYNLTVEPYHTFIANGVRVHNGGHRERYPEITGAGGSSSKSSGGGRAAVESPDTLRSRAKISLVDLLGEGEIGGLVDGAKSIFLDDTPLMGESGQYNFSDVEWDFRAGTQNQAVIPGLSDISSPTAVGQNLTFSVPYSFTITNSNVDRVRVVVNVLSLMRQNTTTGDLGGASVSYRFMMSVNGGAFAQIGDTVTIKGKTRSKYQRSHIIELPKPASTWTIRVERMTQDSTSSALANGTQIDSYVEIVDAKLNYPNAALATLSIDPEAFSRVPRRSYLLDGILIRVPSNYDPINRTYSGIWDGTTKLAVSSNPAWILYDLLTSSRYGLGKYIQEDQINIAKLYQIGQYCDGMVDNGFGQLEPRFAINTVIQTRSDAYKLISDISSAFRGMTYWGGGLANFTQDAPGSVGMVFSQANVVDGIFSYTGSSRKDRHSVVLVTWNDPTANYKQRIAYVEDADLIKKFGIRQLEVVAFGSTSQAQAVRAGRWILYTELYESNLINFKVGMDAALLIPGEIVRIHDTLRAGKRMSGRIKNSTLTSVTLDAPVELATTGATLSVRMPDGGFENRQVLQGVGSHTELTWVASLPELPVTNAMYVVSEINLVPMLARVVDVKPGTGDEKHTFEITAVEHNPTKYAAVEDNLLIETPPTSIIDPFKDDPTGLSFDESTYFIAPGVIGSKLHISWEGKAKYFEVSYRITLDDETSNWEAYETRVPTYEVVELISGSIVDVRVVSISTKGSRSKSLDGTFAILGKTAPPAPPTNLTAASQSSRSILVRWTNPPDIDFDHVEIYMSTPQEPLNPEDPLSVQAAIDAADDSSLAVRIARTSGDTFLVTELPPKAATRFFWAKAVDTSGNKSQFNAIPGTSASTEAEADYMVALLENKIGSSTLSQELAERIDGAVDLGIQVDVQQGVIDGVLGKYTVKIDHNGYVSGYGLMSEENDGAVISEFAVRADRFSIGSPSGSASELAMPFMVLSAPTVIDGTMFDPGVYMNSAMITKLTASQIDTRGLTVKDDDGRIILSTGVPLDYDTYVTNKPEMLSFHDTFQAGLSSSWHESPDSIKNGVYGMQDAIDALSGGRVLRIGDNSGNNMVWFVNSQKFAFDPTALYQIKCRVRRLAGSGSVYVGLVGVAADGVTLVNNNGANSLADQHFVVAAGANPGSSWVEYVGYVKGVALQGTSVAAPSIESPGVLHQNVKFIRPVLIANYNNQPGITEFDVFSMTQITADLSTGASVRYIYSENETPPVLPPSNQTTGWDITPSEFAIWATLQINTTSPSGVITEYGAWGQPVKIKGSAGPSGASGQAVDIIFRRSSGQPATPNSSPNTPNLWYTNVDSVPNGPNPLWSCVGKRSDPGANWVWETPVKISGETVVELLAFRRLGSQPTTPTGGIYNAATNVFTPPSNWSSSIPEGADQVWMSVGLVTIGGSETIGTPTWSSASKAFQNGENGLNGKRTAILDVYRWAASPPTSFPTGVSTYTWSTAQFTAPASLNGWSLTPPSPVSGQNLYICRQLYSDNDTSNQTQITWTASVSQVISRAGVDGSNGESSLSVIISNEAHTLSASSSGNVSSYVGSGATIQVYEGTTALTANATLANGRFNIGTPVISPSGAIAVGNRTYSGTTATVAQHSGMTADVVTITYPINIRRLNGTNVTLNKVQTLSKGRAGVSGESGADAQYVSISGDQSFKYLKDSSTPTNATIVLTATLFGGLSGYQWQYWNGSAWSNISGATSASYTLAHNADIWSGSKLRIRCMSGGLFDEITLVKLFDGATGAPAHSGYLTNESHALPSSHDGSVYNLSNAGGVFKVFEGSREATTAFEIEGGTLSGNNYLKSQNGLVLDVNRASGLYSLSGGSWSSGNETFTLKAVSSGADNLLLYPQQMENSIWSKVMVTITPNASADPNGTMEGAKLASAGDGNRYVERSYQLSAAVSYVHSVYAKEDEFSNLWITPVFFGETTVVMYARFDLETGTAYSVLGDISASGMEYISNGWYRCWMVVNTPTASTLGRFRIELRDNSGSVAFPNDNTSGIYIWGAQVTKGEKLLPYIPEITITKTYTIAKAKEGDAGPQGVQGADGSTTYTWIRYADNSSGSGISNSPTGKTYIGLAHNKTTVIESNTPSDYTWSLIKGTDGVAGPKGEDGQTTYTWIKYSDVSDGTGLYDIPNTGTEYIGIATNKTTPVESTNKLDYVWSKFRGEDSRTVSLSAPTLAFTYNSSGTSPSPANTVVTATAINTTGTPYYRFLLNGSQVQHTTGNTYTYTPQSSHANMPQIISVELREGSTGGSVLDSDVVSMVGIKPGVNGRRTAFLELYKWAATKPTGSFPSGNSTYTWATGAFTLPATNNGWSLLPGNAVPGQTLWSVGQVHSDTNTTATSNVTWSVTSEKVNAVGAAGTNGANGQGRVNSFAFRRATTTPATPTGGTFSSPNPTTTGWSDGIPTGTNPVWVTTRIFTSDGLSPQQSNWATPVLFAQNGESANGGSVRYKFSSNITAPSTGTGGSTYPGTGWSANASPDTIWMTQQVNTVNSSGAIVSHGNWHTPIKIKGEEGPSVTINPSRAATFTATDGVLDSGQSNILFSAAVYNISSPSYVWSIARVDGSGTTPTASSTSSYSVTAANMGTSKALVVTCEVSGSYIERVTVARLEKSTAEAQATKGASWGVDISGQPDNEDILNSGPNLLKNPDFDNAVHDTTTAPGWTVSVGGTSGVISNVRFLTLPTSTHPVPWDKDQFLFRVITTGTDSASWAQVRPTNFIDIDVTKPHTMSAWVLSLFAGNSIQFFLECRDKDMNLLGWINKVTSGSTGIWERHSATFTPSDFLTGTTTVRPLFRPNSTTDTSVGEARLTRVALHEGTVASKNIIPFDKTNVNSTNPITSSNASIYIANAAIGSAHIANAAIGSAHIADAAITSAKIGDAQVDTLQIAGNAVTVPVSVMENTIMGINVGWHTLLTLQITVPEGTNITVIGNAQFNNKLALNNQLYQIGYGFLTLERDGLEIATNSPMENNNDIGHTIYAIDAPPAGTHTYTLRYRNKFANKSVAGNAGNSSTRFLMALGSKR